MKVSLIMVVSADGFIARRTDEASAFTQDYDPLFFDPKTRDIGTVIIGMNSYRLVGEPFQGRLTIVFSSSTDAAESIPGTLEFYSGEPRQLLEDLEKRGIHEVALVGGSQINSSFLAENLVDEIYLIITPLLFGQGLSLAATYDLETKLKLEGVQELGGDALLVQYSVMKDAHA